MKFSIGEVDRQDDGLYVANVTDLAPEPSIPLPDEYQAMASLLEAIIDDLGKLYEPVEKRYDDAGWVGLRFAEILPMELEQKQACLEMDDPIERLASMRPLLRSIRAERPQ